MKLGRRTLLKGAGGVALALPFLESLAPRRFARADDHLVPPYAIFFRQANGVAALQDTDEIGSEPERFWPTEHGALTAEKVAGRALEELSGYLDRLLVVDNVNMEDFPYGDGHARGALQGLTARGPTVANVGGDSEASGESLDHRIGRELNADDRESLFLFGGQNSGWLGGACISYREAGSRRAAINNPVVAYETMMGISSDQFAELAARQQSINDLVRGQMQSLMTSSALSADDRRRLEIHQQAIRDLETSLSCLLTADQEAELDGASAGFESDDGDLVMAAVRAHMDVAALAVACGYTRSVAIQVGNGNDGTNRYRNIDSGQLMENFHFISHRRSSHDSSGSVIPDSDYLHHLVDRTFAQTFKHLLDRLSSFELPSGGNLLDAGISVWYNDNGNGPGHSNRRVPYIIAGSANGFLRTGEFIAAPGDGTNHARLLNTLGSAAGLRKADGDFIDDFGDPSLDRTVITELLA